MKKTLLSFLMLVMFCSVSWANSCEDNKKILTGPDGQKTQKDKCNKCTIEDDEYCIYNECFLDKQFREMKIRLCLDKTQENCIDNVYRNFKSDLESVHARYRTEKNKLLEMIECEDACYKKQADALKAIKKDIKEKFKDFNDDIKEQLCPKQKNEFRKFKKEEKKKMKKFIKYGAIYKLPCVDCCKQ